MGITPKDLNGALVYYRNKTAFIALPREQWREIEGGCKCHVCVAHGADVMPVAAYWDTLAIGTEPDRGRCLGTSWLVHMPALHEGKFT